MPIVNSNPKVYGGGMVVEGMYKSLFKYIYRRGLWLFWGINWVQIDTHNLNFMNNKLLERIE